MGRKRFLHFFSVDFRSTRVYDDIDPDEIFLDSSNLPDFDTYQFEGRIVKSLSKTTVYMLGFFFVGVISIFLWRIGFLQIVHGGEYADISENNRLAHTYLFPERGVVFDVNKNMLAWNTLGTDEFSFRAYTATSGLSHVLGYIKYPQSDTSGIYYKTEYTGETGVERMYNKILNGKNGLKIVERNALFEIESESVIDPPEDGDDIVLTIDARVQAQMYALVAEMEALKATVLGMTADNLSRISRGLEPGYTPEHFEEYHDHFTELAKRLRTEV